MTLEQARTTLQAEYERAGFDIVTVQDDGTPVFRHSNRHAAESTFCLVADDIQEYAHLMAVRDELETWQLAIGNANYYEHLLTPLDPHLPPDVVRGFQLQQNDDSEVLVEVNYASPLFSNLLRFEAGYMALCVDHISQMPKRWAAASQNQPLDIRRSFSQVLTIRVHKLQASSPTEARELALPLLERSLFTLAADFDMAMDLARAWPRSRLSYFAQLEDKQLRQRMAELKTITSAFRTDLVRLYLAGVSSSVPSLQFLAFYQVLLFFMQSVNDAAAHAALATILSERNFEADDYTLARIVATVKQNSQDLDMQIRLLSLLRQHADAAIEQAYIDPDSQLPDVANRLIATHAVILEALRRPVPTDAFSPQFEQQVPLLRFLAKRVITATGAT